MAVAAQCQLTQSCGFVCLGSQGTPTLQGVLEGERREGCHHGPDPALPTTSHPGEAVWRGQGFGCSSTALEQLSGHKYQPDDSAASLPLPRAGSSRARGCLPVHEVLGSWCWVLSPLRQHGLGQDASRQGQARRGGVCGTWLVSRRRNSWKRDGQLEYKLCAGVCSWRCSPV